MGRVDRGMGLTPERAGVFAGFGEFFDAIDDEVFVFWVGDAEPGAGGFEDFDFGLAGVDEGIDDFGDVAFGLGVFAVFFEEVFESDV